MVMFGVPLIVLVGPLLRSAFAAGSSKPITRRESTMSVEVDSGGDVSARKLARRETAPSESSTGKRALSRKQEAAKERTANGAVMLGGVPVHNYDLKQPAHGSDAAQFVEMGGNLDDWEGEIPHLWIVQLKDGVTKAQLDDVCKQIRQMRNNASCDFEGDPVNGINEFTIFATEAELGDINQKSGDLFLLEEADGTVSIPHDIVERTDDSSSLLEQGQSPQTNLWGLDRLDDRVGQDKSFGMVNGGAGVHVYVHDTGIRCSHTQFQGRCIPTLDLTSGGIQECNGSPTCAADRQGHGTHCAGTVAGYQTGVAKQAVVHAVKVLSDSGSGQQSWGLAAMNWLATRPKHAAVMSASLGGPGQSQTTTNAVQQLVNRGVTVVVAAGNDNVDACGFTPAGAPAAITVGATQEGDRRASFSNFGRCVDIFAPGAKIQSAGYVSDQSYQELSGTSMACPHVSGAVAVLRSQGISAADVEGVLKSTATQNRITDPRGTVNLMLFVNPNGATPTGPAPNAPVPAVPVPAPGFGGGACADVAGWRNKFNYDCSAFNNQQWCTAYGGGQAYADNAGVTANQACCFCGGGTSGGGCTDYPWRNKYNKDCSAFNNQQWCTAYGGGQAYADNAGVTANQACCFCGGGKRR